MTQEEVLEAVRRNPGLMAKEICLLIDGSCISTVSRCLSALSKCRVVRREITRRGAWRYFMYFINDDKPGVFK